MSVQCTSKYMLPTDLILPAPITGMDPGMCLEIMGNWTLQRVVFNSRFSILPSICVQDISRIV